MVVAAERRSRRCTNGFADNREELILAQAMIYFVFLGAATVAIALAAHVH